MIRRTMSARHPARRLITRPRVAVTAASLVAGLTVAMAGPALGAVNDAFELEGNVLDAASPTVPDWGAGANTSIFVLPPNYNGTSSGATGVPVPRSPLPSPFTDAGFAKDFVPGSTADTTTFTTGSKDLDNVGAWACKKANNVTDKGDIQNAYATVATVGTDIVVYFGMEKNAPNGDNNMGIWLLQDGTVACDSTAGTTNFTGNHKDGDILLVAAFTNGGSNANVTAYKWVGGATGALTAGVVSGGKCGTAGSESICAITNTATVDTPWLTVDKVLGQGTKLGADQFYEGAVNLTANKLDRDSNGNPICTNKFLFNTRSSQQTSATLYDWAEGSVKTCFNPTLDTLLYKDNLPAGPDANDTSLPASGAHTVTLPQAVYDTSNLAAGQADPTGTITYSVWSDSGCSSTTGVPLFANNTNMADPVSVGSASPSLVFTSAGTFYWRAHYTPSATSRNAAADSVCSNEPLTVVKPGTTISTTPSASSITIGGTASFNDVATVTGFFPAGGPTVGTVTFQLYGPFSTAPGADSCVDAKLIASASGDANASRVNDSTATATSASYTPTAVGIYQWTARYNGNDQNLASTTSPCGLTAEQVTVQPATPSLATTMLLSDKVKVSGVAGAGPVAGTVTFSLYASADCSGSPVAGGTFSNVAIDASGIAQTSTPVAVAAGTYAWKVTFTPSSSSNYTGGSTTCTAAQSDETATFAYAGGSPIS